MKSTLPRPGNFDRLKELYAMLAGVPGETIQLSYWRNIHAGKDKSESLLHGCGTSACVIGYATAYPPFVAQGFTWDVCNELPILGRFQGFAATEKFFGLEYPEARALFTTCGDQYSAPAENISREDRELHQLGQKRQVLARIRNFLLIKKAITEKRASELKAYEATLLQ